MTQKSEVQKKSMKGTMGLSNMWTAGLAFVILAIVLGMGAMILGNMANQTSNTSTAYTIINQGITAISTLASWQTMLAIVIAGVVVLVIIVKGLGFMGGGSLRGE